MRFERAGIGGLDPDDSREVGEAESLAEGVVGRLPPVQAGQRCLSESKAPRNSLGTLTDVDERATRLGDVLGDGFLNTNAVGTPRTATVVHTGKKDQEVGL